jgi:Rod binding domain-containing protein
MTAVPRLDIATQQPAAAASRATSADLQSATTTKTHKVGESEKIQRAARDFETVFLRQMLVSLERTTKVGDKGPNLAGQQAYGSMIVEAVADAVAQAGGIGLGSVLAKALITKSGAGDPTADAAESTNSPISADVDKKMLRSVTPSGGTTDLVRISPQGLSRDAVPRTEIRTSAAQITGQLADRRIR